MNGYVFANFHYNAQSGLISDLNDSATSDIVIALLDDTYTPAQNRHDCWSAPDWVASTAYEVGNKVKPTTANGHLYECVSAGTTGTGEPTWPTNDGEQISDSGAVWECIADGDISFYELTDASYSQLSFSIHSVAQSSGITVFDANDVTWSGADFTARYGVIFDNTPAGLDDKKLLCYLDFLENKTVTSANFQITWDTEGIFKTTVEQPV